MVPNLGSSGNSWYIKASVKQSSGPVNVILQEKAKVIDGVAKFENLGLSHTVDSFSIEFSFDTPSSLNQ